MPPEMLALWQRALICRTFPAYKISDLDREPALPILNAMRLLDIATATLREEG